MQEGGSAWATGAAAFAWIELTCSGTLVLDRIQGFEYQHVLSHTKGASQMRVMDRLAKVAVAGMARLASGA